MQILSHQPALRSISSVLCLIVLLAIGFGGTVRATALQQPEDEAAALFQRKCAACHTIGGGALSGPDLQGVTLRRDRAWLIRWLAETDQMLAEGDPIATQLLAEYNNMPMPNMGLSEEEATTLVAFMEGQDHGVDPTQQPEPTAELPTSPEPTAQEPEPTSQEPEPATQEPEPTPEEQKPAPEEPQPAQEPPSGDPAQGQALFTGQTNLVNGGPACLSCHTIAGAGRLGGALGPDLTPAYANYGGDTGMAAILAGMPFPTMNPIYGDRPLTAEEQVDLIAFLRTAEEGQASPPGWLPVALAGGGFVVLAGISQVAWRRRLPGVRRFLREKG